MDKHFAPLILTAMSGTCNERLLNGEICGRPEKAQGKCIIHWGMNRGPQPLIEAIREYIRDSSDDRINLSNLQFDNLVFPEHLFPTRAVSFEKSRFIDCRFEDCVLSNADFSKAMLKETSFIRCTFSGVHALFKNATFMHTGDEPYEFIFGHCIFAQDLQLLDFSDIEWHCRQRPFVYCTILACEVDLSNADIRSDHFTIGIWDKKDLFYFYNKMGLSAPARVNLSGLTFHGHFELGFWPHHTATSPNFDFRNIDFGQMLSARFLRVNLQKADFLDSDIETVSFKNVIWPTKDGHKIICDEFRVSSGAQLRELETIYTQLKRNYEDHRNYPAASDWHYREMEARRRRIGENNKYLAAIDIRITAIAQILRQKPFITRCASKSIYLIDNSWWWLRRNIISFVPWYKYLSNYGENYRRPFVLLFLTTILAGVGYSLIGIQIANGTSEQTIHDFLPALILSSGNMVFVKSQLYTIQGNIGELINILQKIFLTLFGSLFLLALRRRFRR